MGGTQVLSPQDHAPALQPPLPLVLGDAPLRAAEHQEAAQGDAALGNGAFSRQGLTGVERDWRVCALGRVFPLFPVCVNACAHQSVF